MLRMMSHDQQQSIIHKKRFNELLKADGFIPLASDYMGVSSFYYNRDTRVMIEVKNTDAPLVRGQPTYEERQHLILFNGISELN